MGLLFASISTKQWVKHALWGCIICNWMAAEMFTIKSGKARLQTLDNQSVVLHQLCVYPDHLHVCFGLWKCSLSKACEYCELFSFFLKSTDYKACIIINILVLKHKNCQCCIKNIRIVSAGLALAIRSLPIWLILAKIHL